MTKQYLRDLFRRTQEWKTQRLHFIRHKDADILGERAWMLYRGNQYCFTVWEYEIVPHPF